MTTLIAPPVAGTAVEAVALARSYGEGDSAVHALRGVSLAVPAGPYAAD